MGPNYYDALIFDIDILADTVNKNKPEIEMETKACLLKLVSMFLIHR